MTDSNDEKNNQSKRRSRRRNVLPPGFPPKEEHQLDENRLIELKPHPSDKDSQQPFVEMTSFSLKTVAGKPAWRQAHRGMVFKKEALHLVRMMVATNMISRDELESLIVLNDVNMEMGGLS